MPCCAAVAILEDGDNDASNNNGKLDYGEFLGMLEFQSSASSFLFDALDDDDDGLLASPREVASLSRLLFGRRGQEEGPVEDSEGSGSGTTTGGGGGGDQEEGTGEQGVAVPSFSFSSPLSDGS